MVVGWQFVATLRASSDWGALVLVLQIDELKRDNSTESRTLDDKEDVVEEEVRSGGGASAGVPPDTSTRTAAHCER